MICNCEDIDECVTCQCGAIYCKNCDKAYGLYNKFQCLQCMFSDSDCDSISVSDSVGENVSDDDLN